MLVGVARVRVRVCMRAPGRTRARVVRSDFCDRNQLPLSCLLELQAVARGDYCRHNQRALSCHDWRHNQRALSCEDLAP